MRPSDEAVFAPRSPRKLCAFTILNSAFFDDLVRVYLGIARDLGTGLRFRLVGALESLGQHLHKRGVPCDKDCLAPKAGVKGQPETNERLPGTRCAGDENNSVSLALRSFLNLGGV